MKDLSELSPNQMCEIIESLTLENIRIICHAYNTTYLYEEKSRDLAEIISDIYWEGYKSTPYITMLEPKLRAEFKEIREEYFDDDEALIIFILKETDCLDKHPLLL